MTVVWFDQPCPMYGGVTAGLLMEVNGFGTARYMFKYTEIQHLLPIEHHQVPLRPRVREEKMLDVGVNPELAPKARRIACRHCGLVFAQPTWPSSWSLSNDPHGHKPQ